LGERLVYELKVLLSYQRILNPRSAQHTLKRDESKEIRDFMTVEEKGVHHKKYDGHCTKQ
jgi:hypothetical protein